VAQSLAGGGFGATNIPRIGHEVLVSFVDGDPDRPVVIGSVYNSKNKPPVDLPANKNQMGYRSSSSKGGGGANEWLFDDTKGAEKVSMTAQRDYSLTVKNNAMFEIGYETAEEGSLDFGVHMDRHDVVTAGDYSMFIYEGNRTSFVKKLDTVTVEGDREEVVTGKLGSEAKVITMNGTKELKAESKAVQVDGTQTTKIGSGQIEVDGTSVTVTAKNQIVLSCAGGASSIILNAAGVTIVGPLVKIN
jgi:type VI secretion system secreted protein VgrG